MSWKLQPLDCTAWWYFSEASGLRWEQSQKMSSRSDTQPPLALYQQTGLTWQHSFCHLMVFKWADTVHLRLPPPWHLLHQWQFVYSSTDCAVSSQMLCPHCHWSFCIDFVYSWCKSIYRCGTPLFSFTVRYISSSVYVFVRFQVHLPLFLPLLLSSHPAFIVLADSPLLFYPVISCSPIHPLLPEGLFMLGLAARTSLTPSWEA